MNAKYLFILISFFTTATMAQEAYTVNKGDTLLSIADKQLGRSDKKHPQRYKVAQDIRKANPQIKNPNALEPGQVIILPTSALPVAQPSLVGSAAEINPTQSGLETQNSSAVKETQIQTAETKPAQEVAQVTTPTAAPTTLPAATPATAPTTETPAEHKPEHGAAVEHSDFFFVQPRYQVLTLEAKNSATKAKTKMESDSSLGLDLQFGKILNHHWHLLFQAGFTRTNFKKISTGTVNHTSETLKSFAIGVAYEATSTLHLDLLAMYTDRTFLLPGTGTTDYDLKAVTIPGAELNISWDFYSGSSNIFGISAIGEYVASHKKDGIDYKSAVEPLGALYWKSKNGHDHMNYKVTLIYKHGHQETNVSEQTEDLGILGVGFYF